MRNRRCSAAGRHRARRGPWREHAERAAPAAAVAAARPPGRGAARRRRVDYAELSDGRDRTARAQRAPFGGKAPSPRFRHSGRNALGKTGQPRAKRGRGPLVELTRRVRILIWDTRGEDVGYRTARFGRRSTGVYGEAFAP